MVNKTNQSSVLTNQIRNKKLKRKRKIYYLKLFIQMFFIKDPDPDH